MIRIWRGCGAVTISCCVSPGPTPPTSIWISTGIPWIQECFLDFVIVDNKQLKLNLLLIVPGVIWLLVLLCCEGVQLPTWVHTVSFTPVQWKIISMTLIVVLMLLVLMTMIVILMGVMMLVLRTCVWQVWAWKRGLAERGLLPLSAHPLKQFLLKTFLGYT